MLCAICYNLYNLINVKNNHGRVSVFVKLEDETCNFRCIKSVRIRSYSGRHFSGKMRTRITLNTDTFYAVFPKGITPLWVFFTFFNCINGTKFGRAFHINIWQYSENRITVHSYMWKNQELSDIIEYFSTENVKYKYNKIK